jgi:methyl-accepting chemotaxis protein
MTTVSLALLLGLAIAANVLFMRQAAEKALVDRARLLASLQSQALAVPIWNFNTEQVKAIVGALAEDPAFVSATVRDTSGTVIHELQGQDAAQGFIEHQQEIALDQGSAVENLGVLSLRLSTGDLQNSLRQQLIASALGLVLLLAVANAAVFLAIRMIMQPLNRITSVMVRLAKDELDAEVPSQDRADEVGEMARAVQVFKDNAMARERLQQAQIADQKAKEARENAVDLLINNFGASLAGSLGAVGRESRQMLETAAKVSSAAGFTRREVGETNETAEQTRSAVESMAAAAEELSASIREIGGQVARTAEEAAAAAREAEISKGNVAALVENSQTIGQIVGLISDIANRTNLLALNATI